MTIAEGDPLQVLLLAAGRDPLAGGVPGLRPTRVRDRAAALAALRAGRFEAIVVDAAGLGDEALTACAELAAQQSGGPLVLVTNDDDPALARGAAISGVDALAFRGPGLKARLRSVLAHAIGLRNRAGADPRGRAAVAPDWLLDALDSISEAFVLFDENDRLILCNRKYKEFYHSIVDLIVPGVHFDVLVRALAERGQVVGVDGDPGAWVDARLAAHQAPRGPHLQHLRDGRWLLVSERHTRDGGTASIRTDVTKVKLVERALHRSEQRFREMAEVASDWFWEMDRDLRFTYVSQRFFQAYGLPREALIGRTLPELAAGARPGGGARPDEAPFRVLKSHDAFRELEHAFAGADGAIHYARLNGNPLTDGEGRFLGYHGTGSDVTRRRKDDERLRLAASVFETSLHPIFITDADVRIIDVNPAFTEITGYAVDEAVGRSPGLLSSGRHGREFYDAMWAALARDGHWEGEIDNRRKNGEVFTEWLEITSVIGARRAVTHYVAQFTDLSERKRAERDLERAKEAAEASNRAKTDFLANMSHELRTPLNAIIGFSGAMLEELYGPVGDPRYREYLTNIGDSGMHLLDMINDILDVSKIEAGKLELFEEEVDVARLIRSSVLLVRDRALDKGLHLDVDVGDTLPRLWVDGRRFKQILLNLLSNAVKFTPGGGSVRVEATVDPTHAVHLSVSDSGIGMSPDQVPVAFAPFGQVASAMTRSYEGTGLGLPLVKALSEMHGARLDVETAPGRGTTIRLHFPPDRSLG